jgi:hypothetical protein
MGTVSLVSLVDWPEKFGTRGTENSWAKLMRALPMTRLGILKEKIAKVKRFFCQEIICRIILFRFKWYLKQFWFLLRRLAERKM